MATNERIPDMETGGQIEITANAEAFQLEPGTSLPDFLDSLNLDIDRVVIELNEEALSPSEARSVRLSGGEALEIVKVVSGGLS